MTPARSRLGFVAVSSGGRVDLAKAAPKAYDGLLALAARAGELANETDLDPRLVELIKLRISQINGCAFCLRMHTRTAVSLGESADRLAVLPGWRETTYFSPEDCAALALGEAITLVGDGHVDDATYAAAEEHLSGAQISAVSWLAIVMNAFNRVAITSRYVVEPGAGTTAG